MRRRQRLQGTQVGGEDVAAHLSGHPLGLEQRVHAQPVKGGQEPLGFRHECLMGLGFPGAQKHDETPDDGSYGTVAPLGFCGQYRFDACSVTEGHPDAGIHRQFFVQGKELAEQVQDGRVLFLAAERLRFDGGERGLKPAGNTVNHRAEREGQEFVAAGEVVAYRAHCQPGLICYFPQGCPFQAITGNDPENSLDNFLAPGFGINNFGH